MFKRLFFTLLLIPLMVGAQPVVDTTSYTEGLLTNKTAASARGYLGLPESATNSINTNFFGLSTNGSFSNATFSGTFAITNNATSNFVWTATNANGKGTWLAAQGNSTSTNLARGLAATNFTVVGVSNTDALTINPTTTNSALTANGTVNILGSSNSYALNVICRGPYGIFIGPNALTSAVLILDTNNLLTFYDNTGLQQAITLDGQGGNAFFLGQIQAGAGAIYLNQDGTASFGHQTLLIYSNNIYTPNAQPANPGNDALSASNLTIYTGNGGSTQDTNGSFAGDSGELYLYTGNGGTNGGVGNLGGNSGDLNIATGSGGINYQDNTAGGKSGDVGIDVGIAGYGGAVGSVKIGAAISKTVSIGNALSTTTINGVLSVTNITGVNLTNLIVSTVTSNVVMNTKTTNSTGRPLMVISGNAIQTTASVVGMSQIGLFCPNVLTNFASQISTIGGLTGTYTNPGPAVLIVPTNAWYWYTNTSSGAGDTSSQISVQLLNL